MSHYSSVGYQKQKMTFDDYRQMITPVDCLCGYKELHDVAFEYYPHAGGVAVTGHDERQWVYIVCPKCNYQWALWKLVRRHKYNKNQLKDSVAPAERRVFFGIYRGELDDD